MAHLLIYKQQHNSEVRFVWPRPHLMPHKIIIPFFGTPKDGFKASKLHTGMVVMMENGISGLRRRFWIIGLLWNSGDMTECMILINSNYNDGVDYAFGVVLRNVDSEPICGCYRHEYHHHNTEGHKYNRMNLIRSKEWIYNPRMQHLFLPDMGQDFDFLEIGGKAAELERLPAVNALQVLNDADDANQFWKLRDDAVRTYVVI